MQIKKCANEAASFAHFTFLSEKQAKRNPLPEFEPQKLHLKTAKS